MTVGKRATRLIVVDLNGKCLTWRRALGRYFAKILSALILLFGFFMIGWTARKQGLHDKVAGTLVVRKGTLGSASVF